MTMFSLVNDAVRKAVGKTPTDVLSLKAPGIEIRVDGQGIESANNLFDELITQTFLARVVPVGGFGHVVARFRAYDDGPAHGDLRARNRAFISFSERDD